MDENVFSAENDMAGADNIENNDPVSGIFGTTIGLVQSYGWLLLIVGVAAWYLKTKYYDTVYDIMENARRKKTDIDGTYVAEREAAREAAIQRLQESHDAKAAKHAEEMKIKEELKREQKIKDWENHQEGKGYRNKYKPTDVASSSSGSSSTSDEKKPKKYVYRSNEYNPLMGGSDSWTRPTRRGGAGGGG